MIKNISIVIAVYKETDNLLKLNSWIEKVITQLTNYNWVLIFVNDGSPNDFFDVLQKLALVDNRIKAIDFSRNFGKEIALTAGTHEEQESDAVICIDADLQYPPELMPLLIQKWEDGAKAVVTVRTETENQSLFRRLGSFMYYWLMRRMSGIDMKAKTTDRRLYDKRVVKALILATERERIFRGIMDWMGFRRSSAEFSAPARTHWQATYSYGKLWRLAVNSLTTFSLWPLRLTDHFGTLIC